MFVGRTAERKTLEEMYSGDRSSLVILYGRPGIGKTALIAEFLKEKPSYYYLMRECSVREQLLSMQEELDSAYPGQMEELDISAGYDIVLSGILKLGGEAAGKQLIVLDEFHLAMKEGELSEAILQILIEQGQNGKIMILLCSSSVNWVENEMVQELGRTAKYISNFMKLKELTFMELGEWFPRMPVEDCIAVNAVIGGVPRYLMLWDERKSTAYNIKRLFLSGNSPLYPEAELVLKCELRELAAYNTILRTLAAGKYKLNDIYARTGYSRAKISVYLKNLIHLDLVEKVFSADTDSNENVQKGLYRIKDNFLNFWYRFVFPNQSMIAVGQGDWVYDERIRSVFPAYMRESFSQLCIEYLKLMGKHKRLRNDYELWNSWYGKTGRIDILAKDTDGKVLAACCDWSEERLTEDGIKKIQELVSQANVLPAELYIFTKKGVTSEAKQVFAKQPMLRIIELKDL